MPKHWIRGAISHPGVFKAAAEKAGKSTAEFATEHEHDSGKLGSRARLAKTLMGMHHADGGPVDKSEKLYGKKKVSRNGR